MSGKSQGECEGKMKKYSKKRFLLLEEAGEAAQDVAKLGAGGLRREGVEQPQRAAGWHNSAEEGRQHLQQRAGAGRRNARREAEQGRRFVLLEEAGEGIQEATEQGAGIVPGRSGAATEGSRAEEGR